MDSLTLFFAAAIVLAGGLYWFVCVLQSPEQKISSPRNYRKYLPHEIIENILFRLPVKSLLRFKSVRKQWNATISDPKFAQTHLQISKNSSSLSFILRYQTKRRAKLVSFENHEFRRLPAVDRPPHRYSLMCHCDGLYVVSYSVNGKYKYALWNPSRRSYKELNRYRFDHKELISGICYDPLLNDYKVVIGDAKHYAVFYCRKNHWSDLIEMNPNLDIIITRHDSGAPLKGSIYWVSFSREEDRREIVCFDGRDEKWKNLGKVGIDWRAHNIKLISSGEGLYLFHYHNTPAIFEMKKVGDGDDWVELPTPDNGGCLPVVCGHENKLLLRHCYGDDAVIYDVSKRS